MSGRAAHRPVKADAWRHGTMSAARRNLPEETPVAIVYDGATYAVMMATPCDLADFARGFSLTEGVVTDTSEILDLEIAEHELGMQVRLWLSEGCSEALGRRSRRLAGPVGCGLCGIESLAEASRPVRPVSLDVRLEADGLMAGMAALAPNQPTNIATRATHAAGFWHPRDGLVAVREDVGRHNALDKLVGALAERPPAERDGAVLLTSRVSVEMVQKTAAAGIPVIAAVSAPTTLAVRVAEAAGITLVAVARADGFEVFAHPRRIVDEGTSTLRASG